MTVYKNMKKNISDKIVIMFNEKVNADRNAIKTINYSNKIYICSRIML